MSDQLVDLVTGDAEADEPKAPRHGESVSRDVLVEGLRADVKRYRDAYQAVIKQQQAEERLIRMFETSIRTFPALPAPAFVGAPVEPRGASEHYEVPVLVVGDQQIGEVIAAEETNGVNAYDFGVFQARLEHLEDRVLDILQHHQGARHDEIVILSMGDNISGRIHEELQKYGHQHVIDQVYIGALAMALFVYRIAQRGRFQRVRVSCVSGNHGRLGKEKESKQYYKNFDYLFHSIMTLALRDTPRIEFHVPKCLFTVVDVAKHRILQSHGHELPPSSLGIPLYSINRASAGYQELLAWSNAERFDYWIMGHFHRPMELDSSIVNGTMAGIGEFGIGKFKPIRPVQKLLGMHTRWGKAWEYQIRLDRAPSERRIYRFDSAMGTGDAVELYRERVSQVEREVA